MKTRFMQKVGAVAAASAVALVLAGPAQARDWGSVGREIGESARSSYNNTRESARDYGEGLDHGTRDRETTRTDDARTSSYDAGRDTGKFIKGVGDGWGR